MGELGCLYQSKRTCSVVCRYYNTLARISLANLRPILTQYPKLRKALIKNIIMKYDDPIKKFLIKVLRSIPLFQKLSIKKLMIIAYTLKSEFLQKDEILLREQDQTNDMYIV